MLIYKATRGQSATAQRTKGIGTMAKRTKGKDNEGEAVAVKVSKGKDTKPEHSLVKGPNPYASKANIHQMSGEGKHKGLLYGFTKSTLQFVAFSLHGSAIMGNDDQLRHLSALDKDSVVSLLHVKGITTFLDITKAHDAARMVCGPIETAEGK